MPTLFDPNLREMRRNRAFQQGAETFLHDRAFEDLVERLSLIDRKFDRALMVGCLNPDWAQALSSKVGQLDIVDPASAIADIVGGTHAHEAALNVAPGSYDLVLAIGTLDTVDALPETLARLRFALSPGGLLLGAMAGGECLPALRAAMAKADALTGSAAPRTHPRIDPASLTQLLANAGLAMPVVDVDAVTVRYSSFDRLITDLRAMGATNILSERSRKPLSKRALAAVKAQFSAQSAADGKTEERFDILHLMGWAPEVAQNRH